MTPCMGGWCHSREQCPHYHAEAGEPAERLCVRGADGKQVRENAQGGMVVQWVPIVQFGRARAHLRGGE